MASRSLIRVLMTGAAIASLSTAAMAEGWSSYIVFGDRQQDSGQYISRQGAFGLIGGRFVSATQGVGDGRLRDTNTTIRKEAIRDRVYTQMLGEQLGLGEATASQPIAVPEGVHEEDVAQTPDGLNYASLHYHSADVLNSITGTAQMEDLVHENDNGELITFESRTRPGLLNDPDRQGVVQGALVVLGGGGEDIRGLADIKQKDGANREAIDLIESRVEFDAAQRSLEATQAADNIAAGAQALADAGAGLVVVMNQFDLGETPERTSDLSRMFDVRSRVNARFTAANVSASNARIAEDASVLRASEAVAAHEFVIAEETRLNAALDGTTATEEEIADISSSLEAARTASVEADAAAETARLFAIDRQQNAEFYALRPEEISFIENIDILEADPSVMAQFRTDATNEFNARLVERLRAVDGNVLLIDQHALMKEVIADPARFGLDPEIDHANECLFNVPSEPCTQALSEESETLFGTVTGLGTGGQQLIADQVAALLVAPGALSGIPYVTLSSARSVADTARDQVSREQSWHAGVSPIVAGAWARSQLDEVDGVGQNDGQFLTGMAGVKYSFGNGVAFGVLGSYQNISAPSDNSAIKYDGSAYYGTVFAGVNSGPLFGSMTASYGKVNYGKLSRVSQIGAAQISNGAEVEGSVRGVTAEAGIRLVEYDVLRGGPIANFSHWKSEVDGFREDGWKATAVEVADLEGTSTRAGIGVFMEAGGFVDGQGSLFRAKLLYGHEFADSSNPITVTPLGDNAVGSFTTSGRGADNAPLEFGAEVVFGFAGLTTTFGYDGLYGDVMDHRFRVSASMPLGG